MYSFNYCSEGPRGNADSKWFNRRKAVCSSCTMKHLTFIGPCIVISFYSKTNQMHQLLKFILFWNNTLHVSEISPSIIRSSRLYTYVGLLSKTLKIEIYKTIILPVVLYGCETWSLTLREERRLRVFENKVLRRVFGPKRDEVTGEWRKLHNEKLRNFYSLPNIV